MQSHFQPPIPPRDRLAAAPIIDTTARWLSDSDDVALGCECANPALQIERWGQDAHEGAQH